MFAMSNKPDAEVRNDINNAAGNHETDKASHESKNNSSISIDQSTDCQKNNELDLEEHLSELQARQLKGFELDKELEYMWDLLAQAGPAEKKCIAEIIKDKFNLGYRDINQSIRKARIKAENRKKKNRATSMSSAIISEEAHRYYKFSHVVNGNLFSCTKGRIITKTEFKDPFNDQVMHRIHTETEEGLSVEYRNVPGIYRNFSPVAYNLLVDRVPLAAPILGFSRVGKTLYLVGQNGVYEFVETTFRQTDKIQAPSNDNFKVVESALFEKPPAVFEKIYSVVSKFSFQNPDDAIIYSLYIMYLANWQIHGQVIHGILTGGTGSGKTASSCLIVTPVNTDNAHEDYIGYSLIPHAIRLRGDSTTCGIQEKLEQQPGSCLVLDEAEKDQRNNTITSILRSLRAASGGGEFKARGGKWKDDTLYPPTILSGIHLNLNSTDCSRFVIFDFVRPDEKEESIFKFVHRFRKNRDGIITELLTCLIPFKEQLQEFRQKHKTNRREYNIHLPLRAIASIALVENPGLMQRLENRLKVISSETSSIINDEEDAYQQINEIINTPFILQGKNVTLLEEASNLRPLDYGKWHQVKPYLTYVRKDESQIPRIAIRRPLTFLRAQLKYKLDWTNSFENNNAFVKYAKRWNIGRPRNIKVEGKTTWALVLNPEIYVENTIEEEGNEEDSDEASELSELSSIYKNDY